MKLYFYILIALFFSSLFVITSHASNIDNSYVRVVDGHLYKNGKRLRLWGVNLQSGAFKSYAEIDRLVLRLTKLGFNAVRLWPSQGTFYSVKNDQLLFNISSKGDGSDLDRFDYLVAKLSDAGFSLQMTMLHYRHHSEFDDVENLFIRGIFSGVNDVNTKRLLIGILPYISKDYKKMYFDHVLNLLNRTNPYTQKKYSFESSISTWELANESHFVSCLTTDDCIRKLPLSVIRLISLAWEKSPYNPSGSPIPMGIDSMLGLLKAQYNKFVVETFIEKSKELESYSKKVGGLGSGIRQQPFLYNTGPVTPSAMGQKAYGAGDVFSLAGYHSPLVKKSTEQRIWLPISEGGREIPYLGLKTQDKPFIIYETSFFRPYPYRAEWGVVLAALALQQDWDGVFLYMYGQPWAIYADSGRDSGYGYKPIPIPRIGAKGVRGHYSFGFHQGGDPVSMASWSLASSLFLGANNEKPLREIVWDISEDELYLKAGYPNKILLSRKNLAKGMGVNINFIEGHSVCAPCRFDNNSLKKNYVKFDQKQKLLTVKTKGGRAFVGQISGELGEIYPGIRVDSLTHGFGLVGVADMGGGTVRLFSIKNVENNGFQFNPNLVDINSPVGAMNGVVLSGGLPLKYQSLDIVFSIDKRFKSVKEFDFGFYQLGSSINNTGLKKIKPNAKTFYMELRQ